MMRARQSFVYNGRYVKAGDQFGLVESTTVEQTAVRRVLVDAGLAEGIEADLEEAPTLFDKKRYQRRDLRAEG